MYSAAKSRRSGQHLKDIRRRTAHVQPSDTPLVRLLREQHLRSNQRKSNVLVMVPRTEAATAIATIAPVPSGWPDWLLWIVSTVVGREKVDCESAGVAGGSGLL